MEKECNSKFLYVKCNSCDNEQTIFGKSTTEVKCLVCGETFGTPTGGKIKIKNCWVMEVH